MLYIASALSPTPILDTLRVEGLTGPKATSLVIAKPDRVEVWDVDESGLSSKGELQLWGRVMAISKVESTHLPRIKPHILVLLGPPNAHLLLLTYQTEGTPSLVVTSTLPLSPPTPTLRQAEFFTGVISSGNVALVSLWVGVLSCIEMEIEKDKDKDSSKRRRSSAVAPAVSGREQKLVFKEHFNINIREHNLLHLAFLPGSAADTDPMISFLWLSSASTLHLQARRLSTSLRSFSEVSKSIDIVMPTGGGSTDIDPDADFNDIPFSCPAARRVLPINQELMLVIGDEHSCLYSLSQVPQSPRASKLGLSSSPTTVTTSPRASATRRSPQNEMTGNTKRRKASMTGQKSDSTDRWELRPVWRVRQGFGTVLAAAVLEDHVNGASALLGDECGRLTALTWEFDAEPSSSPGARRRGPVSVRKIDMGVNTPPSSLTYLGNSRLFLTSACGDSSLLTLLPPVVEQITSSPTGRVIPARKGKGRASTSEEDGPWSVQHLDSVSGSNHVDERWMNLAPLRDFDVVREEGGGVSHMVIASGVSNSNSLRIVRSGVGLEDVVSIEGLGDVTDMWDIHTGSTSMILASTSTSTFALHMEPEISSYPLHEKLAGQPTITAGIVSGGCLQITAQSAAIWSDLQMGTASASWDAASDNEIVAAAISEGVAVVAQRTGKVDVLDVAGGLESIVTSQIESEVSSLSIFASERLPSPMIAIATWTNEILLYTLDHLRSSSPVVTSLTVPAFAFALYLKPSSAASASTSSVQLIAGLSDGSMVTFALELSSEDGGVVSTGQRTSSLGTRPLKLCPMSSMSNGEEKIVAVGLTERMSVIFESKGRIEFSTASRKDITSATKISTTSGDVLVLATPSGITLTKVNSLKKLSVQTLDTGNRSANKITSLTSQSLLVLGSVSRVMDTETGDVIQSAYLQLRDPTTLELHVEMPLKTREEVTCLREVFLMGRYYIAVGTALLSEDEDAGEAFDVGEMAVRAKSGRLLLVSPEQQGDGGEWMLNVVLAQETTGSVNDFVVIHGLLVVAAASMVSVHRFSSTTSKLEELDRFCSLFLAQHLQVVPPTKLNSTPRLAVGDGMRSITLIEVDEENGHLYPGNRDMATHQVTALESIKDRGEGCIIADGYSNLLTFRMDDPLESAASFGLHEDVARFRQGSLVPPSSAPETMTPDLLFATTDGRIGMIGELTPAAAQTMDDLQRNMAKYHKGPGGMEWKTWRQGGTEMIKKDTAGFVDGDFIQRFLDTSIISSEDAEKSFSGTNSHEQVGKLGPDGKGKVAAERADVVRVLEAAAGLY